MHPSKEVLAESYLYKREKNHNYYLTVDRAEESYNDDISPQFVTSICARSFKSVEHGRMLQKDDVIKKHENAWWNPSKISATSKHPVLTVSGFSILIPLLFFF
tara:strand:- start:338 stop:646 length:309 start_codon:yes stop_codon:yes gene_type:complete